MGSANFFHSLSLLLLLPWTLNRTDYCYCSKFPLPTMPTGATTSYKLRRCIHCLYCVLCSDVVHIFLAKEWFPAQILEQFNSSAGWSTSKWRQSFTVKWLYPSLSVSNSKGRLRLSNRDSMTYQSIHGSIPVELLRQIYFIIPSYAHGCIRTVFTRKRNAHFEIKLATSFWFSKLAVSCGDVKRETFLLSDKCIRESLVKYNYSFHRFYGF